MKVADLRLGLELYKQSLEHWGAKGADVADLEKFIQLLGEHDEITVASLCAKFSERTAALKQPVKNERAVKGKLNAEVVDNYTASLRATGSRTELLAIVEGLKADRSAKLGEVLAIANALTESGVAYTKKPQALEALINWINRKFDTERRLQGTSGIF